MSDKELKRVIREDTRIALQKVNEMKSSWGDLIGAGSEVVKHPIDSAMKAYNKFSRVSKKAVKASDDAESGADRFKDIPRTITRQPGSPEAQKAASDLSAQKAKNEPVYHAPGTGSGTGEIDRLAKSGDASAKAAIDNVKQYAKDQPAAAKDAEKKAMDSGAPALPKDAWETPKAPETPKADTPKSAPGTSKTAQSFKQAFSTARKEAKGGKGQFEYDGKKYQTNIAPAKGAEKYISTGKQHVTSVKVGSSTEAPKPAETPAPKTEPEVKASVTTAPEKPAGNEAPADTQGFTKDNEKKNKNEKPQTQPLGECVVIGSNKYRII